MRNLICGIKIEMKWVFSSVKNEMLVEVYSLMKSTIELFKDWKYISITEYDNKKCEFKFSHILVVFLLGWQWSHL